MIVLNGNSATATIQLTKGGTFTLPITKGTGTFPDFDDLTWTGGIYTQSDGELVSAFTVAASSATALTITISATITAALEWQGVSYGFNIKGTTGSTVYIPIKGNVVVHRADG